MYPILFILITAWVGASTHSQNCCEIDSHTISAPIGVMGDHMHPKGEWMLSIRHMNMDMQTNRSGGNILSSVDIFNQGYMVAPLSMNMSMNMLSFMKAPSDDINWMIMIPQIETNMHHEMANGRRFKTRSKGLGDIKLSLMQRRKQSTSLVSLFSWGVSVPTGSIEERDFTPMNANALLPYPMQLGSGTYDFQPSYTVVSSKLDNAYGFQCKYLLRTGKNKFDYRLGNRIDLNVWRSKQVGKHSLGLRLSYNQWENIKGRDSRLNPGMVPTADPNLRDGRRLKIGLGFNLNLGEGALAFEWVKPILQRLKGPQLGLEDTFTIGYKYTF